MYPHVYTAISTFHIVDLVLYQLQPAPGSSDRAAQVIVIHDQTLHQLVIHQVLTDLCTSRLQTLKFWRNFVWKTSVRNGDRPSKK